jgi:hypothetical protein
VIHSGMHARSMDMQVGSWRAAIVTVAFVWMTTTVVAQGGVAIAGAGAAPFPSGTTLNLIALNGLEFGVGATATSQGAVIGDLHLTLVGTSALGVRQEIIYDGRVDGVTASDGTATLIGVGTLDMADGTPALTGVPFTLTATAETVALLLGVTALPQATLSRGVITIK